MVSLLEQCPLYLPSDDSDSSGEGYVEKIMGMSGSQSRGRASFLGNFVFLKGKEQILMPKPELRERDTERSPATNEIAVK